MRHVRPTTAVIIFGLAPPAVAAVIVALAYASRLFSLGPFEEAFIYVVVGALVVGSPPMGLSGYTLVKARSSGSRLFPWITFGVGFIATSLTLFVWSIAGWLQPNILLLFGVAAIGGVAVMLITALVGMFGRMLHSP